MTDQLLYEVESGVATLTFNRPDRMNTITPVMLDALSKRLLQADRDRDVRVIVVTGNGRAFCAGLDLKELSGDVGGPGQAIGGGADLVGAMHAFERPIIGAVNGFAITGGFEVALACDILIGSTEAPFSPRIARSRGRNSLIATSRSSRTSRAR